MKNNEYTERQPGETWVERKKLIVTKMKEYFGDGWVNICNSTLDILYIVVKKIEKDRGCRVLIDPNWPDLPLLSIFKERRRNLCVLKPDEKKCLCGITGAVNGKLKMAVVRSIVKNGFPVGIRTVVTKSIGIGTQTVGVEAAQ